MPEEKRYSLKQRWGAVTRWGELVAERDGKWVKHEDYARLQARLEELEDALRTIDGPADSGPWILIYREAGGGYEGLQAIARAAIDAPSQDSERGEG